LLVETKLMGSFIDFEYTDSINKQECSWPLPTASCNWYWITQQWLLITKKTKGLIR
jgi:hypothetical protein